MIFWREVPEQSHYADTHLLGSSGLAMRAEMRQVIYILVRTADNLDVNSKQIKE